MAKKKAPAKKAAKKSGKKPASKKKEDKKENPPTRHWDRGTETGHNTPSGHDIPY